MRERGRRSDVRILSGDRRRRDDMLRGLARGQERLEAARAHARPGAGSREILRSVAELDALASGLGPDLAPCLADPQVTDLLVNGTHVWVDRGSGLERLPVDLGGHEEVRALAVRMAAACGKRLDDASPVVDGTLPGGARLHAVLPPLSACGPVISVRTFSSTPLRLEEMEAMGAVHPLVGKVLRLLVSRRANVLVAGATGSGKTTLLAALLALVPPDQRIVCIEEVTELRPNHPHVVSLQERRPNVQGVGGVSLSDLVRAAMRMRPDRIVLGECRGVEVRDVLTALNTGHDGGWATLHANSAEEVPARLHALGALAGLDPVALDLQALAAFHAVVHLRRRGPGPGTRGGRWVAQVGVLSRKEGSMVCLPAIRVDQAGAAVVEDGWPLLAKRLGVDTGQLAVEEG